MKELFLKIWLKNLQSNTAGKLDVLQFVKDSGGCRMNPVSCVQEQRAASRSVQDVSG